MRQKTGRSFPTRSLNGSFVHLWRMRLPTGQRLPGYGGSTKEVPGGLAVCIEDNGAGIARDKKESIFMQGSGKPVANSLFMAREILAITGISVRETGQCR